MSLGSNWVCEFHYARSANKNIHVEFEPPGLVFHAKYVSRHANDPSVFTVYKYNGVLIKLKRIAQVLCPESGN